MTHIGGNSLFAITAVILAAMIFSGCQPAQPQPPVEPVEDRNIHQPGTEPLGKDVMPQPVNLPFKPHFRDLKPDPLNPPLTGKPCINVDPSNPDLLEIARQCPFRHMPELPDGPGALESAPPGPDLIIAAHQTAIDSDGVLYSAVTIRNIGDATAVISTYPPHEEENYLSLQFWLSQSPLLEGTYSVDWIAAGGWRLVLFFQELGPGEEVDIALNPWSGWTETPSSGFNYVIAQLIYPHPLNDVNPDNNISAIPLIPFE